MARRRKRYRARLSWVVVLLVSAVVAYCVLGTLQEKYNMDLGLPELNLPSIDFIDNVIEGFLGEDDGGNTSYMPNALQVSGEVQSSDVVVHMLDMGQADSYLIQAPGATVLIDAGENNQGDRVLQYLGAAGVEEIDILIGTHFHSDHIGGMDTVIESGIPIGRIILPDVPDSTLPTTRTYTDLLQAIADHNVPLELARPGSAYDLGGGAALTVLGPVGQYGDLNNTSVVSKLTYGEISFLFCGDMETQAELDLVNAGADLSAQILQAPHHGSSTSSSTALLDAVRPSVVLISCGLDNSYGHPHREVMERYAERGVEVFRTDLMGAVVIICDGKSIAVETAR